MEGSPSGCSDSCYTCALCCFCGPQVFVNLAQSEADDREAVTAAVAATAAAADAEDAARSE